MRFKVRLMARAQAASCPPVIPVTLGQPSTVTSMCRAFQHVLCGQRPRARGSRVHLSSHSATSTTVVFAAMKVAFSSPNDHHLSFFSCFLRAWRKRVDTPLMETRQRLLFFSSIKEVCPCFPYLALNSLLPSLLSG